MKLTIPDIGTKLQLTKTWKFNIYPEDRNKKLYDKLGYCTGFFKDNRLTRFFIKNEDAQYEDEGNYYLKTDCFNKVHKIISCEIESGVILIVDRIYIRKGMEGFSSITFRVEGGRYDKARFWVKLKYANQIEFELPKQDHKINYDPHLRVIKNKVISLNSIEKYIVGDNKIAIFPIKIYLNGTSDKVSLRQQITFKDLTNDEFKKSNYPNHIFGKVVKVESVKYIGYDLKNNKPICDTGTLSTSKKKIKTFCNENY